MFGIPQEVGKRNVPEYANIAVWRLVTAWNHQMESAMLASNSTENMF